MTSNEAPPQLGRWLSCLYRQMQCLLDRAFEPVGLGSGNYAFLLVLKKQNGQTQEALRETLRFDKGTTARALKKLEYLGFIERHRCKDDARANQVFLTSRGENVLPFVEKVLKELSSQIQEGLSPEERATAFYLISRMASNALLLKNDELSVLFNKE